MTPLDLSAGPLLGAVQTLATLVTHSGPASILFVSSLGFILGIRHATDADHIVALSTIVSRQRSVKRAALIGSLWGLGHTITIFTVGSLIIVFNVRIPTRLGLSLEFSVAVMLVVLGVLNLSRVLQRVSSHIAHAGRPVAPDAGSDGSGSYVGLIPRPIRQLGMYHGIRPFVIGLVHGLAGSAAVALLVLSTIHSPLWATTYLLIFGFGTIVGMVLMTTAVAVPLTYSSRHFAALNGYLAFASGVVSLCFGSFLVYRLGYIGGLFSQHPQWTPQ